MGLIGLVSPEVSAASQGDGAQPGEVVHAPPEVWEAGLAPAAWVDLDGGPLLAVDPSPGLGRVFLSHGVGAAEDAAGGRPGLTHLLEHLLFVGSDVPVAVDGRAGQGSEALEAPEAHLAALGAWGRGVTGPLRLDLLTEGLPRMLPELLAFEQARTAAPLAAVGEEGLANELSVVSQERAMSLRDPARLDLERLARLRWGPDHPYAAGVLGSEQDLAQASLGELRAHARAWLRPEAAVLVLGGPWEAGALLDWGRGAWQHHDPRPARDRVDARPRPQLGVFSADGPPDGVALYLAFPTPPRGHPDEAAVDLLADLLVDGEHGVLDPLLGRRVREVRAWTDTRPHGGTLTVRVLARPQATELLLDRVTRRIARWRQRGPDPERVAAARDARLLRLHESLEDPATRATAWARCWHEVGRPDCLVDEVAALEAVDAEVIARVARTFLYTDEAIVLAVVPGDRPELAPPAAEGVPSRLVDMSRPGWVAPEEDAWEAQVAQEAQEEDHEAELPLALPELPPVQPGLPALARVSEEGAAPTWVLPVPRAARVRASLVLRGPARAEELEALQLGARVVQEELAHELAATSPLAHASLGQGWSALRLDLELPAEALARGLDLAWERVCSPELPAGAVRRLGRELRREARREGLSYRDVLRGTQARLMFPAEHPLGQVVDRTARPPSPRAVRRAWQDRVGRAGASWVLVGEASDLAPLDEGALARRPDRCPGAEPEAPVPLAAVTPPGDRLVVVDWPLGGRAQVLGLFVGPAAASPDAGPLGLLVDELAAGDDSRLLRALRQERGWAYTVEGHLQADPDQGRLRLLTEVGLEHLGRTLLLLEAELAGLVDDPPDPDRLRGLQRTRRAASRRALDSAGGLRQLLADALVQGWDPAASLAGLGVDGDPLPPAPERLAEVAARWLAGAPRTWVIVGDAEAVEAALADHQQRIHAVLRPDEALAPRP